INWRSLAGIAGQKRAIEERPVRCRAVTVVVHARGDVIGESRAKLGKGGEGKAERELIGAGESGVMALIENARCFLGSAKQVGISRVLLRSVLVHSVNGVRPCVAHQQAEAGRELLVQPEL